MKKNSPKSMLGVISILVKDDQVLLGQRRNAYGSGLWGLPGGKLDTDESLENCFKRELAEEVGIKPVEHRLIGVVKEWQATIFFIHFVYACLVWEGQIRNLELDKSGEWQWFKTDSLPENMLPGHKAGVEILMVNKLDIQIVEL